MHVAIIMDGNGRWATRQGRPRIEGHRAGAQAVRRAVEAAGNLGVDVLTLYAFSSDNWKRPRQEVNTLMRLLADYLRKETRRAVEEGVKVRLIGRRDRLPAYLRPLVDAAERATAQGTRLELRLAVDYSSRDQILAAARARLRTRADFSRVLGPDVDLLIRTGGEQRLSDFLLWECAYAELVFLECLWPEFDARHFDQALAAFRSRERRFGGLPLAS